MTGNVPLKTEAQTQEAAIDRDDLRHIRHLVLSNISGEILQISDLVEDSIVDLSDEFLELVKYSKQQVDDMTTACGLLQGVKLDVDGTTQNIIHEMLMASAEISTCFHQNVNRMIYTMQFQDRARQRMQAISASLNILITLSQTAESGKECEKPAEKLKISENNKNILSQLINKGEHQALDHNYILKMFLGPIVAMDEAENNVTTDLADVEFF